MFSLQIICPFIHLPLPQPAVYALRFMIQFPHVGWLCVCAQAHMHVSVRQGADPDAASCYEHSLSKTNSLCLMLALQAGQIGASSRLVSLCFFPGGFGVLTSYTRTGYGESSQVCASKHSSAWLMSSTLYFAPLCGVSMPAWRAWSTEEVVREFTSSDTLPQPFSAHDTQTRHWNCQATPINFFKKNSH